MPIAVFGIPAVTKTPPSSLVFQVPGRRRLFQIRKGTSAMIVGKVEKQPFELFPLGLELGGDAGELAAGDTIANVTVKAKNEKTGVDTTGAVLLGTPTIDNLTQANQIVQAGVVGDSHLIEYQIITALGHRFESEILLVIVGA